MAIELITGHAGTNHIDSADFGAFNAGVVGPGIYILDGCECVVTSANSVTVAAGELLCEGRHTRITGSGETLAIANGMSGYKRNDIIAAHYVKDGSGVESVTLTVVKGNAATSSQVDPSMPAVGRVLDGASDVYWPLYRIVINGLTPQTPERLAVSNPLITVRDVLPIPNGGTGATSAAGALANLGINDHIVTEGTTNGWTWVKYANGIAACYRNMSLSGYTTSQWGTWRYTSVANSNFPFAFVEVPAVLATSRHIAYVAALTDTTTTNPGGIYFYTQQNASYTDTINASIYAVGRWK